jgi:hypothetical protein
MIDKDQVPAIMLMINEIYAPVILRSIVNLVLMDIANIVKGSGQTTKQNISMILNTETCQKILIMSLLEEHQPRGPDIIEEILKQYGLHLRKDEQDFYQQYMGNIFEKHVEYVKKLLQSFKYDHLYNLSRAAVN